ncbi:Replication factor C small subunit [ANME-1 cluster archaeon GoMg1]|nr:Replication factor C small subunit [ANME-1 cluster archaeon GoMg1]
MWAEKYRPKRLDEIAGQEEVVNRIKGFVKEKTIPNLLLWGPKGTGKTSFVYALANELYGSYDENVMLIETSDFVEQRKKWLSEDKRFKFFYDEQKSAIDIFKEIIREYAALRPINAPFKLLFFNNADLLPRNAQQALRRVIERSNKTCRFIFSTTRPAGIIPPVRSRCLNLHFTPLDKSDVLDALIKSIAEEEGLKLTEGGVKTLRDYARGDAGAAINMLEAAATTTRAKTKTIDAIGIENVVQNAFFQRNKAEGLIDSACAGRYKDVRAGLEFLIRDEKMGGKEILVEIHEALRRKMKTEMAMGKEEEEQNLVKRFAQIVLYEGEADLKLCNSLNSIIHLEEMMTHFFFFSKTLSF